MVCSMAASKRRLRLDLPGTLRTITSARSAARRASVRSPAARWTVTRASVAIASLIGSSSAWKCATFRSQRRMACSNSLSATKAAVAVDSTAAWWCCPFPLLTPCKLVKAVWDASAASCGLWSCSCSWATAWSSKASERWSPRSFHSASASRTYRSASTTESAPICEDVTASACKARASPRLSPNCWSSARASPPAASARLTASPCARLDLPRRWAVANAVKHMASIF
mmetsp:Transcript_43617/g.132001  ORF Transcript_43617/g.132001 Transcript_43617/m.132001 type:complete len:228 (-) Transcript_43617:445-1128(-)